MNLKSFQLVKEIIDNQLTSKVLAIAEILVVNYRLNINLTFTDNSTDFNAKILVGNKIFEGFAVNNIRVCDNFSPEKICILLYKNKKCVGISGNVSTILRFLKQGKNFQNHSVNFQNWLNSTKKPDFVKVLKLKNVYSKDLFDKPLFKSGLNYFNKHKNNLVKLFSTCPREKVLESLFNNSKWVYFKLNGRNTVVGIVYENNRPSLIGLGYPSFSSTEPYKIDKRLGTLKKYSISKTSTFGYYVTFRRATTGKKVI